VCRAPAVCASGSTPLPGTDFDVFTGPLTPEHHTAVLEALRVIRDRVRPEAAGGAGDGRRAALTG
jgi:hypothetical protein